MLVCVYASPLEWVFTYSDSCAGVDFIFPPDFRIVNVQFYY